MKKQITLYVLLTLLAAGMTTAAQSQEKIAIYRWNHGNDWVEARDDEGEKMAGFGYKNKTFVCYLYQYPQEGTVAINRWHFQKTDDWVTVREDESSNMERFGYNSKILLGYAYPSPRRNTTPINRWNLVATGDWVTVPESASNSMQTFGYTNKTLVAYTPQ
jgi:hypothetical protein